MLARVRNEEYLHDFEMLILNQSLLSRNLNLLEQLKREVFV